MRTSVTSSLFLLALSAMAQLDTTFTMDQLRAPSSPGSVLLGVSESDIQRPTDPVEFSATLRQATNDYTQLPKNFAVDLAPWLIWGKPKNAREILGLDSLYAVQTETSKSISSNIQQTFALSFAVKDLGSDGSDAETTTATNPQMGIGFKCSLFRGTSTEKSAAQLRSLGDAMDSLTKKVALAGDEVLMNDEGYQALLHLTREAAARGEDDAARVWAEKAVAHASKTLTAANLEVLQQRADLKADADSAHARASSFKMEREGFFWDLAGGLVLDYMDRRFDNSYVTKAGLWTSLGNNVAKANFTYQAQLRYLFQPDNAFMGEADSLDMQDIHLMDGGARFSWDPNNGRISFSVEALYRACLNVNAIDPTWRLVANADYDLGNNKRLTFSFGRNFDGSTSQGGNLVSALNLILGFGHKNSTKALQP